MRKGTGFTLIELIVVIAIIAILAAIVAPNAFKAIEKARISSIEGDYRNIKTGAMSYYSDTGNWPANNNTTGFTQSDGVSGWSGPYMEKWPQRNAWGGVYLWRKDTAGVFAAANVDERYIVANQVAASSAGKIDLNMDDNAATTGVIRYSGTPATVNIVGAVRKPPLLFFTACFTKRSLKRSSCSKKARCATSMNWAITF